MFEKKKKATKKNEDLMKKAPAAGAVELGDDVLEAAWAVGVAFQDGRAFHGPCHVRINLALPMARVEEAFRRLDKYVFNA